MDSDALVGALPQVVLVPSALHVIQEDVPSAWTKLGFRQSQQRLSALQAPAHHLGIRQLPAVIADRSPAAVVVKLDAARASAATVRQTQGQSGGVCCGEKAHTYVGDVHLRWWHSLSSGQIPLQGRQEQIVCSEKGSTPVFPCYCGIL